jgi:hypothetical protein
MEDIVNCLRSFKSAAAQSWAHEAADEIESLRTQLAEERQQLLATQAHAARLVEALNKAEVAIKFWADYAPDDRKEANNLCGDISMLDDALSTPINLDALHEALARECERLAHLFPRGSMHAHKMLEEAAYHMAKKDSHQ